MRSQLIKGSAAFKPLINWLERLPQLSTRPHSVITRRYQTLIINLHLEDFFTVPLCCLARHGVLRPCRLHFCRVMSVRCRTFFSDKLFSLSFCPFFSPARLFSERKLFYASGRSRDGIKRRKWFPAVRRSLISSPFFLRA